MNSPPFYFNIQNTSPLNYGRSPCLNPALSTVVNLGEEISWEELLEASRAGKRIKDVKMSVETLTEIVRGPDSPLPYVEIDDVIVELPEYTAKRAAAVEVFRKVLVQQLALTPRKEVFIFVHGFHNDFNDAAFAMAELWHFLGRIGVPIIYTWPAGHPGFLLGYTYDRESSEFTIYHLRQVIELMLDPSTLSEQSKLVLDGGNANIAFINYDASVDKSDSGADSFGHSYFRNAPTHLFCAIIRDTGAMFGLVGLCSNTDGWREPWAGPSSYY